MSEYDLNDLELKTPKTIRNRINATSTAHKPKNARCAEDLQADLHMESSLGLLSLNNVDLSNIIDVSMERSNFDLVLSQQRQMANNTLNRASKVAAIPSKFLQADLAQTKSETNLNYQYESTVNESDLLKSVKNTSTPRNSTTDNGLKNLQSSGPRESIFSLFKEMLDSNISTHNAAEEFRQLSQAQNTDANIPVDSNIFVPAEEAASRLLADELSWQKKHDMPVNVDLNSFQEGKDLPSMSIGEFFKQRSDNISEFHAVSPKKSDPLALIDLTECSKNASTANDESEATRSLSITAIQQLLADVDDTPTKVMDYLFNQKRRTTDKKSVIRKSNSTNDIFSLPVSRDTSYTSSVSDNEAVRVAIRENKENQKPLVENKDFDDVRNKQSIPQNVSSPSDLRNLSPSRSSSSLSSLPNGKLPIESTVNELVWGCVKVDRCVTKEFMLRNKTPKTLRLQCSLSTYEFKIRKDNRSDSDPLSACKFVLHGHESRPLIISYIPTKVGAAVDQLVFAPLDPNLTQTKKQCIRLYGYGGYSNIEYNNAMRDNTGKYWLSLGRLDNRVLMEQSFTVKNTGNLPSFACIKVIPKHIVTFSNLKVEPNLFVLLPSEEKAVRVTYIPNAKDCRILKQNLSVLPVIDIGKLEIVSGPEVSRARLRRLCRKSIERGLEVDAQTKILKERIGGEVFPADITKFKESPTAIPDILETLKVDEIVVTIEQDPNQTLVAEYPEDSVIFQSLCQDNTLLMNESVLSHTSCRLEPPALVLLPPSKQEDSLFLISETTKTLHFEVKSNPVGLKIIPTDGILSPGETTELRVNLSKNILEKHFKVFVYVENEVFESEVKILSLRNSKSFFLE